MSNGLFLPRIHGAPSPHFFQLGFGMFPWRIHGTSLVYLPTLIPLKNNQSWIGKYTGLVPWIRHGVVKFRRVTGRGPIEIPANQPTHDRVLQPHRWCLLGHCTAWICGDLTNVAIYFRWIQCLNNEIHIFFTSQISIEIWEKPSTAHINKKWSIWQIHP